MTQDQSVDGNVGIFRKHNFHKTGFIQANCDAWFRQFADSLERSAKALVRQLQASQSDGPEITISRPTQDQIVIAKEDLPGAYVSATLSIQGLSVETESTCSAKPALSTPVRTTHWEFDVNAQNRLFLASYGTDEVAIEASSPEHLSELLMSEAFMVR